MSSHESEQEAVRWLWYALEDLSLAEKIVGQHLSGARHACWLAQQAAEKALKAILVFEGIRFPKTHDLTTLRTLVPEGWSAREVEGKLGRLTMFSVESRYPGEWGEATAEDVTNAMNLARSITIAARADLRARGLASIDELPSLLSEGSNC